MHDHHRTAITAPFLAIAPLRDRLLQPLTRDILAVALNRTLRRQLADGEFGFLIGRTLAVCITDLDIHWSFTTNTTGDRILKSMAPADATIHGDSVALLLIAARRIDPDTLFFQRRLMVTGDTEFALHARNLLDTLEPEELPVPLRSLLDQAGRIAERWAATS
ncbi:MAG: ubiquinone anaerobic biosynthesis accessory factor UbiT [Halofilum sp. (in: g-proteobacteria)]